MQYRYRDGIVRQEFVHAYAVAATSGILFVRTQTDCVS
jgi:hypothetical protein